MKEILMDIAPTESAIAEPVSNDSWPRLVESVQSSNDEVETPAEQSESAFRIGPYGRRWPVRAA